MWTINDFPTYGNLDGCTTKGKTLCLLYGEHTHSSWLNNSRKIAYLSHRQFLLPSHLFRYKRSWLGKNEEKGRIPRINTGSNMLETLKDFVTKCGKYVKRKQKNDNGSVQM